jgi:hypothetical protein
MPIPATRLVDSSSANGPLSCDSSRVANRRARSARLERWGGVRQRVRVGWNEVSGGAVISSMSKDPRKPVVKIDPCHSGPTVIKVSQAALKPD